MSRAVAKRPKSKKHVSMARNTGSSCPLRCEPEKKLCTRKAFIVKRIAKMAVVVEWYDDRARAYFERDRPDGAVRPPAIWEEATALWLAKKAEQEYQTARARSRERRSKEQEQAAVRQRHAERARQLAKDLDDWEQAEREDEATSAARRTTPVKKLGTTNRPHSALLSRTAAAAAAPAPTVRYANNSTGNVSTLDPRPVVTDPPPSPHPTALLPERHVTSAEALSSLDTPPSEVAGSMQIRFLCTEAERSFGQQDYAAAVRHLTDAVDSVGVMAAPAAVRSKCLALFLSNRSLCHLCHGSIQEAVADSARALELKPKQSSFVWRGARAMLLLGQADRALQTVINALPSTPASSASRDDIGVYRSFVAYHQAASAGRYQDALSHISLVCDNVPETSPGAHTCAIELRKLHCLSEIDCDAALEEATALSGRHPSRASVHAFRGQLQFRLATTSAQIKTAVETMRHAASLGDDASRKVSEEYTNLAALVEQLEGAERSKRWPQAMLHINAIMQCSALTASGRLRASCLLRRASTCLHAGNGRQALQACQEAALAFASCDPESIGEVIALRSAIYEHLQRWDEAAADALEAARLQPSEAAFERLDRIRNAAASHKVRYAAAAGGASEASSASGPQARHRPQPSRPPPRSSSAGSSSSDRNGGTLYDVLGVTVGADVRTIARAYRDAALKWHPDRWSAPRIGSQIAAGGGFGPRTLLEAEERFKAVNHAYSVLSDTAARAQYDASINTSRPPVS